MKYFFTDNYFKTTAQNIKDFFTEHNWDFQFNRIGKTFTSLFALDGEIKELVCMIKIMRDSCVITAFPASNPKIHSTEIKRKIEEFVYWINLDIPKGEFCFDCRTGEIWFYLCEEGSSPSTQTVSDSICISIAMFERYGCGFTSIINYNKPTPELVSCMCRDSALECFLKSISDESEESDETAQKITGSRIHLPVFLRRIAVWFGFFGSLNRNDPYTFKSEHFNECHFWEW